MVVSCWSLTQGVAHTVLRPVRRLARHFGQGAGHHWIPSRSPVTVPRKLVEVTCAKNLAPGIGSAVSSAIGRGLTKSGTALRAGGIAIASGAAVGAVAASIAMMPVLAGRFTGASEPVPDLSAYRNTLLPDIDMRTTSEKSPDTSRFERPVNLKAPPSIVQQIPEVEIRNLDSLTPVAVSEPGGIYLILIGGLATMAVARRVRNKKKVVPSISKNKVVINRKVLALIHIQPGAD